MSGSAIPREGGGKSFSCGGKILIYWRKKRLVARLVLKKKTSLETSLEKKTSRRLVVCWFLTSRGKVLPTYVSYVRKST